MSKQTPTAFTGVFIPSHVWCQTALTWLDKVIWGVVSHWHDGNLMCRATDTEIADHLTENEMVVSASILRLQQMGFLQTAQDEEGRRLWVGNVVVIEKEKVESTAAVASVDDVQKVVDIYNGLCRTMPRAEKLTPPRVRRIRNVIRDECDDNQDKAKDFFTSLFARAASSDFLSGRSNKWSGCNIDWIIAPSNLPRIMEGIYDNRHAAFHSKLPENLR